jgi:hypothetical protein
MIGSPVLARHARVGSGAWRIEASISAGSGRDAAIGRADRGALRGVELALAFGALGGIDDVGAFLEADSDIRAFSFAGATNGAVVRFDLKGHISLLLWLPVSQPASFVV